MDDQGHLVLEVREVQLENQEVQDRLVELGVQAHKAVVAQLVREEWQDLLDLLGLLEREDQQDPQDLLAQLENVVCQDQRVKLDLVEKLVHLVKEDRPVSLDLQVPLDPKETRVNKAQGVKLVQLEVKESLALKVILVPLVQQDQLVPEEELDRLVQVVKRVLLDRLVLLDHQDQQAQLDLKVSKALLVQQGLEVLVGPLERRVILVTQVPKD